MHSEQKYYHILNDQSPDKWVISEEHKTTFTRNVISSFRIILFIDCVKSDKTGVRQGSGGRNTILLTEM
jgi:hypothetical protein